MVHKQTITRLPNRVAESAGRLLNHTSEIAHSVVDEAGEKASAGADRTREIGAELAGRTRHLGPEIHNRVAFDADAVKEAAAAIGHQVANVAESGAVRAKDAGSRVASDVGPALRDLAVQAAEIAIEQWESARKRAGDTPDKAVALLKERAKLPDVAPEQIVDRARHAAGEVRRGARRAADELGDRARVAAEAAAGAAGETAERAGHVAEPVVNRARAATAHAGEDVRAASRQAARTGNDTFGLIFWAVAAAGVVWYVIFNRERREQLEQFAHTAWTQGSELYRDLKGEDEQF